MSSQSFENVTAKWTFFVQQLFFFGAKTISKVAIIKTKSACNRCFFPFFSFLPPRSFLFSFPFPMSV